MAQRQTRTYGPFVMGAGRSLTAVMRPTQGNPDLFLVRQFGRVYRAVRTSRTGGVDTASLDIGQSKDFPVHRIAAARNVAGLENLTNLAALPATGALVIALPMKIEGGSGGPVRVVGLVGE